MLQETVKAAAPFIMKVMNDKAEVISDVKLNRHDLSMNQI